MRYPSAANTNPHYLWRIDEQFTDSLPGIGEAAAPPASNDPELPGPFPVGRYANELRDFLRQRPRVLVIGEVTNFSVSRTQAYFELRDADGALRCSIWNNELERLGLPEGALRDGVEVVVGGGLDYYPGSSQASPSFAFRASHIRLAGEGDLMARLALLRRRLHAEGLFEPQRALPRRLPPRTIGVITGRDSAAAADLRAGFERRGWRGTVIWSHPPVQDRRAAPQIGRALQDLAALGGVDAIVVSRGGGSLADLWAFCDETLCRTVALLSVPVISAVGHESDRTLIDDVAAVACSTPTHAAEVAVGIDVDAAATRLDAMAASVRRAPALQIRASARHLGQLAGVPARHLQAERGRLHQLLREVRAATNRKVTERSGEAAVFAKVIARKGAASSIELAGRERKLAGISAAVRAHEPQRTLERGYALVTDLEDGPISSAPGARDAGQVRVRFADDSVGARIEETEDGSGPSEGSDPKGTEPT